MGHTHVTKTGCKLLTHSPVWDQELDLLKQESVKNHRIWTALGRPRYGNCFEEMRKK